MRSKVPDSLAVLALTLSVLEVTPDPARSTVVRDIVARNKLDSVFLISAADLGWGFLQGPVNVLLIGLFGKVPGRNEGNLLTSRFFDYSLRRVELGTDF